MNCWFNGKTQCFKISENFFESLMMKSKILAVVKQLTNKPERMKCNDSKGLQVTYVYAYVFSNRYFLTISTSSLFLKLISEGYQNPIFKARVRESIICRGCYFKYE